MADSVRIGRGDGDAEVVLVNDGETMTDLAGLQSRAPDADAAQLAAAVLALAGDEYRAIADPAAYETMYRTRLEREDPSRPWRENVFRLCDYGVPDFTEITAPVMDGKVLRFCAQDTVTRLPYRAEVGFGADAAPLALVPISLVPLPSPEAQPVPDDIQDGVVGPEDLKDPSQFRKR